MWIVDVETSSNITILPYFEGSSRFTRTKSGIVVVMLSNPAGILMQYPDGTKRFIAESWWL